MKQLGIPGIAGKLCGELIVDLFAGGGGGGGMITRPLVRYYGGKYRLAPWIISHLPAHDHYIEPFCGAASVLLQKPRAWLEVVNDLDSRVVNLFRVLRDRALASQLEEQLRLTPYSRVEWELSAEACVDPLEQARRFVFRCWSSHGASGMTTKSSTGFRGATYDRQLRTGGHPSQEWARWPEVLPAIVERLRGVIVEHRPAVDVIRRYDRPEALFYVDPPYVLDARSRPDHGYQHELPDDEHRELAEVLHKVRGRVVLSGYASDLYQELYGDWRMIGTHAQADHGVHKRECLWLNFRDRQTSLLDLLQEEVVA